jgi:hypothetical protein
MTRFLSVPLLLICCAGPLAMQPPHKAEPAPAPAPPGPRLKVDAEVKPAGQYATFVPDTDCKAVTYVGLSGVEPIPSAVLLDARLFLLDTRGLQPGRYQFAAVGAAGDRQVRADFAVVVGVPPPPQPPGPGAQPPGPGPSDFAKAIQDAYRAAPDAAGKAKLALYYRAAAPLWRTVSLRPMSALYKAVADERVRQGVSEATLPAVREVIGKAMTAVGVSTDPNKDVPADQREKLAKICESAVAALEGVQ